MKKYKVLLPGFVDENGKPREVGDIVDGNPRNGNTVAGIRFKQLRPG